MNKNLLFIVGIIFLCSLVSATDFSSYLTNLTAYYGMDMVLGATGNITSNLSGLNNGTATGYVYIINGRQGFGYALNCTGPGAASYVTINDSGDVFDFNSSFTIDWWVYTNAFTTSATLIARDIVTYPVWGLGWDNSVSGYTAYGSTTGTSFNFLNGLVFNNPYNTGVRSWTHYAIRRADNNVSLWVNGTMTNSIFSSLTLPDKNTLLGLCTLQGGYANAALDEIGFWKRNLSDNEIYQRYNQSLTYANFTYSVPSSNETIGTVINSPLNDTTTANSSLKINFTYTNSLGYNGSCNISVNSNKIANFSNVMNNTSSQYIWENFTYGTKYINVTCYNGTKSNVSSTNIVSITKISGILKYDSSTSSFSDIWITSNNTLRDYNITSIDTLISNMTYILFGTSNSAGLITESPTGLNVTFDNQIPLDIDSFNIFNSILNITYNISGTNLDIDSIKIYYTVNKSDSNISYYANGTSYSGYFSKNNTSNISDNFLFNLDDNEVYPAIYLYNETETESINHSIFTSSSSLKYLKCKFNNISVSNFSFIEAMINITSESANTGFSASYINSTGSEYQFYQSNSTQINHTHGTSWHTIIPFPINITSGRIGDVKITSDGWISIYPNYGTTLNYHYTSNNTYENQCQITVDGGTSWFDFGNRLDVNIHQYDGSNIFYYYACAEDIYDNPTCSAVKNDSIQEKDLPPSSPTIISPISMTYNGSLFINYTHSVSPNGYNIIFYNISLLNKTGSIYKTIANNSLNLNYTYNISDIVRGDYIVKITAKDYANQTSDGFSENFTIDSPPIWKKFNITTAEDTNIINENISANITDFDNDTISFSIISIFNSTLANCSISTIGLLNITVGANLSGITNCTLKASDGLLESNNTIFINITPVNDAPSLIKNISNCNLPDIDVDINKYYILINLSEYFIDIDNEINYSCEVNNANITLTTDNSTKYLNVSSLSSYVGNGSANCTGTDGVYNTTSNEFLVNVVNYTYIDTQAELCPAIKAVHWKPPTYYNLWKNLSPDRQEYENCLFKVSNNYSYSIVISMSINETNSGYALKCNDVCSPINATSMDATNNTIKTNVSSGSSVRICCFMDYYNPSGIWNSQIYIDGWHS